MTTAINTKTSSVLLDKDGRSVFLAGVHHYVYAFLSRYVDSLLGSTSVKVGDTSRGYQRFLEWGKNLYTPIWKLSVCSLWCFSLMEHTTLYCLGITLYIPGW